MAKRLQWHAHDERLSRFARRIAKGAWLNVIVWNQADRHKIRAIAKWWGWQVWRRTTRSVLAVRIIGGGRLWVPPWSDIGAMIVALGSNEPNAAVFLQEWIQPGDLVIDVGANIGVHTVPLAVLGARVAAIEPVTKAFELLQRSVELNDIENLVRVFAVAVSDFEGRARFTTSGDVGNRFAGQGEAAAVVAVTTIDALVADPFMDRPVRLLKIDAEGSDFQVVRGACELLERDHPAVMVEAWTIDSEVATLLRNLGYLQHGISRSGLREAQPTDQNLFFSYPTR